MNDNKTILIFTEDPGSANYVAQFPDAFVEKGWPTILLADGFAQGCLSDLGCRFESVRQPMTAGEILLSRNPRLVVVGTSENLDSLGLELVAKARLSGTETVGIIDAGVNAAYRFRGTTDDPLAYAPNWLIVPDSWTREAYADLGFPGEHIVVCGHPHYDYVLNKAEYLSHQNRLQMRKSLFPGLRDGQQVVVFLTEVSTGLNPAQYQYSDDYTLHGSGKHQDRTKICLEEFLEAIKCVESKPYLVLRLHPKDSTANYSEYLDEYDYTSMGGSPLELIYTADLVVGMNVLDVVSNHQSTALASILSKRVSLTQLHHNH